MTSFQSEVLIAIPVYNHGKSVFNVIERCKKFHDNIIVINDGSTDLTQDQINGSNVKWIHHGQNRGKGAAIQTAVEFALNHGMTHMITIDADLQHDPNDIPLFKQAIQDNQNVLFVGKRDFSASSIPEMSKFGRKFSNFWFKIETGERIGDAQSGFRAYPLFIFKHLSLSSRHYSFEVEILVKAAWAGVMIRDLDISVHYPTRNKRISHFKLFKDNLRLTHLNTKLMFRSFIPIPHKKIIRGSTPRFSILKPVKSIQLFLGQNVSPFQIAVSGSAGVVLGTLPLIALHTVAILMVSGFFRLNKLVAVGTSQFCMPPIVPALCIETGYFITHNGTFLTDISLETVGNQGLQRIYEWFLGSLIVAPVLGLLTFVLIYVIAGLLSMLGKDT
jgi:glycosyltransferase involved in cell wall biosynthesis